MARALLVTALKGLAALVFAITLAACGLVEGDTRHLQPLSDSVKLKLTSINSSPGEAMMVRIYKEESALEVWKRTKDGTYKLFKTYEICSWSGELGPKFKEGDRQSPEGFYSITPGLMNPRSSYYLAFNTGFPNKFDRVHGRTGSDLMVHGDCSSRGCYAMTDEQIAEIFSLGREAFKAGQRTFEMQIFPFRMTPENLAKHHDSPHIDFWRNLKEGYDAFEISRRVPEWDVCEKRYVFNPAGGPLNAAGACPADSSEPELMAKVKAKQLLDEETFRVKVAALKEKEAQRVADAEAAAAREEALKARGEAFNQVVSERTNAVTGFFSSLFGGEAQASGTPDPNAPQPAPRADRS